MAGTPRAPRFARTPGRLRLLAAGAQGAMNNSIYLCLPGSSLGPVGSLVLPFCLNAVVCLFYFQERGKPTPTQADDRDESLPRGSAHVGGAPVHR